MKNKLPHLKMGGLAIIALLTANSLVAQQSFTAVSNTSAAANKSLIIKTQLDVPASQAASFLAKTYNTDADESFVLISSFTDQIGMTHSKYNLYYKDVVVDKMIFTVHVKDNLISSVSGHYTKVSKMSVAPKISASAGLQKALNNVAAQSYLWDKDENIAAPPGELLVFLDANKQSHLAYCYDVYSVEPMARAYVYVDANTGAVLAKRDRIHHSDVPATGKAMYQGNVGFTADEVGPGSYRLRQETDSIETYSANNQWGWWWTTDITSPTANGDWVDSVAVQAHFGAENTHDYFMSNFGRNSYDNQGSAIRSYVHIGVDFINAFWDGEKMSYGDGDTTVGPGYLPLVALDIVGHEIAHGVTQYAADLIYEKESGALNESFSDIFGEAVERHATGSNDWQLGTEIGKHASGAIRSMNNPNAFGNPDTYGGDFWWSQIGCVPDPPTNDNCGVHFNSGVQNKWFYILSQGEIGTNDLNNSYSVTGIGFDKAAAIAYRNLTVYLTPSSTFADARVGAIQSAIDLNGMNSPEHIATANAWYAVGVGNEYASNAACGMELQNMPSPTWWYYIMDPAYVGLVQFMDVDASTNIVLNDFKATGNVGDTVDVYSIAGSFVGNDGSFAGWTFEGQIYLSDVAGGTWMGLGMNHTLLAGETRGFAFYNYPGNIGTLSFADDISLPPGTAPSTNAITAANGDISWTGLEIGLGSDLLVIPGNTTNQYGAICYQMACPTNTMTVKGPKGLYQTYGANMPNTYYAGLSKAMGIKANPTGGSGAYSFAWSNSAGFQMTGITKQKAALYNATGPTWVNVEITDLSIGCVTKDSVYIDYVDYTCNPSGQLWYYQLCNTVTNTTVCVHRTSFMEDSLKTGNYVFGSCTVKNESIVSNSTEASFLVYPNPSSGLVNLNYSSTEESKAQIYVLDINGRVLLSNQVQLNKGLFETSIDLGHLANGFYLVQLVTNKIVKTQKIELTR